MYAHAHAVIHAHAGVYQSVAPAGAHQTNLPASLPHMQLVLAPALLLLLADMSKLLCEFEASVGQGPPTNMAWCGGDALILQWPGLLLAVGPYGDTARWQLGPEEQHMQVGSVPMLTTQIVGCQFC